MTYRGIHMKRLLLITLMVLSSGPAYAEWVAIEKNNNFQNYRLCTSIQPRFAKKGIW